MFYLATKWQKNKQHVLHKGNKKKFEKHCIQSPTKGQKNLKTSLHFSDAYHVSVHSNQLQTHNDTNIDPSLKDTISTVPTWWVITALGRGAGDIDRQRQPLRLLRGRTAARRCAALWKTHGRKQLVSFFPSWEGGIFTALRLLSALIQHGI